MRELVFDKRRGTTRRSRFADGENIVYDILTTKNEVTGRWRLTVDATSHGNEFRLAVLDMNDQKQADTFHTMAHRYARMVDGAWVLRFERDALRCMAPERPQ